MEKEKYYKRSLFMLSDIIYEKQSKLTKEQCKVISECFQILTKEEVTENDFNKIDDALQKVNLEWMDTKLNQAIGSVLVSMYEENKNQDEQVEWIEARADNLKDIFKFSVPKKWLHNLLLRWAKEDAKEVINDKESYIEGRIDHLYENMNLEMGKSIYEIASKEDVIVDCMDVKNK